MNKEPDAKVPEYEAKEEQEKYNFASFMDKEADADVPEYQRKQSKLTFAKFMNKEPDHKVMHFGTGSQSIQYDSSVHIYDKNIIEQNKYIVDKVQTE